jgi:hypothetical protein
MRNLVIIVIVFVMGTMGISAQTREDTLAIKTTILNYIEGYFYSDAQRMDQALHPELAKRIVISLADGSSFVQPMGKSLLVQATKMNRNQNILHPGEGIKSTVTIYDIFGNAATAKVSTNQYRFIDYIHLTRVNGEWKIINVLWETFK